MNEELICLGWIFFFFFLSSFFLFCICFIFLFFQFVLSFSLLLGKQKDKTAFSGMSITAKVDPREDEYTDGNVVDVHSVNQATCHLSFM